MKKLFILFILGLVLFSCKSKNEEPILIRGEFILIDDAAVIMGNGFIYGVIINDITHELAKKVAPLQREEYDMVPVVIKGYIKSNEGNGLEEWKEIVEITEIIGVSAPTSELPTKIKSSPSQDHTSSSDTEDQEK